MNLHESYGLARSRASRLQAFEMHEWPRARRFRNGSRFGRRGCGRARLPRADTPPQQECGRERREPVRNKRPQPRKWSPGLSQKSFGLAPRKLVRRRRSRPFAAASLHGVSVEGNNRDEHLAPRWPFPLTVSMGPGCPGRRRRPGIRQCNSTRTESRPEGISGLAVPESTIQSLFAPSQQSLLPLGRARKRTVSNVPVHASFDGICNEIVSDFFTCPKEEPSANESPGSLM